MRKWCRKAVPRNPVNEVRNHIGEKRAREKTSQVVVPAHNEKPPAKKYTHLLCAVHQALLAAGRHWKVPLQTNVYKPTSGGGVKYLTGWVPPNTRASSIPWH